MRKKLADGSTFEESRKRTLPKYSQKIMIITARRETVAIKIYRKMITITPKIKKIIENNPIALATVRGNKPYVIGVAYAKVVDQKTILISDNFMNSTVKNILKNNNVALVVWDKKWKGA